MRKAKKSKVIEIKEDVRMPGTDIILEKGDKIEVLTEVNEDIMTVFKKGFYSIGMKVIDRSYGVFYEGDITEDEVQYNYKISGTPTMYVSPKKFLNKIFNPSLEDAVIYTYLDDSDSVIGNRLLNATNVYDYGELLHISKRSLLKKGREWHKRNREY